MMKHIPLVKPEFDCQKLNHAFKEIAASGILTRGKFLAQFENDLKKYLKVKFAFAVSSCTAALHLALLTTGVRPGDEVLTSDFSFPATGNTIVQAGAKPVFVDIDIDNYCINIDDLKKKITKKSRAISVVHPFGYPANMSEIAKIARQYHLIVIEDAACALGSKHKNKFCGTWGDVGCFSFHPRKNITTGEGGALVTSNPKIAQKIEVLRNHGGQKNKDGAWDFIEIGFNYRLSELSAALGVEQLTKVEQIMAQRQKIALKYLSKLQGIEGVGLPTLPEDGLFNFQSFVILLPPNIKREAVIGHLKEKNIEAVLGTYAMHALKSFQKFGYKPGDLPNSYRAYRSALTLPLYSQMTQKEIDYVVREIKSYV